ncbi:MAG TPA: hypothetical protein VFI17_05385 [Solirubrobacterales bacterium]|nr:hypothetical protein [Solirubrobacterales bacterium]
MRRLVVTVICVALFAALWASPADAAFEVRASDLYLEEADGSPANLAGSHPFAAVTVFKTKTFLGEDGLAHLSGALKDLRVTTPPGLVGIPTATPRCSGADFANINKNIEPPLPHCSDDTVIGYVTATPSFFPLEPGRVDGASASALYNLQPPPGAAAKFGFVALGVPVTLDATLTEKPPYRVLVSGLNLPQPLLIYGSSATFWGNPTAVVHDSLRGSCLKEELAPDGSPQSKGFQCPVTPGTPETAFLTLPRACTGPLETEFLADSWEEPSTQVLTTSVTHDDAEPPNPIGFEGCEDLEFDPGLQAGLSGTAGESPSGLDFALSMEDEGISNPAQRAQSDLKKVVATLPQGVTLNPSAANGLAGCTTAEFEAEALKSLPGENCPEAAKVGTVKIKSPLVDEELEGSLFVAQPDDPATSTAHAENPFDSFLAVYLVIRSKKLGVIIKQAGEVEADPTTGQLTTTFDETPQLPFSHLEAHFRSGPRAPLVSPRGCGTYVAEAVQTPWANPEEPVTTTAAFEVATGPDGGPCLGDQAPLAPDLSAGTESSKAGAYSPFNLRITRNDGEQELTSFSATLPKGLTGKLAGVERCPDAAIQTARTKTGREELAAPSCPAGSQIGHVLAGAGVGPVLTYVKGNIYLAGPYGGDPFSVVVITPGVSGPFDVGNIVIREGLTLDPTTAEVQIDSSHADPIPRILKGIPLRLRDLRISTDRPNFILNPTGCEPGSIRAQVGGAGPLQLTSSSIAALTEHFQASDCSDLPFKPKLAFSLKGDMKRAGNPAFRAQLTARPGDSNIGRVAVVLPRSEFISPLHINNPCTRPQFAAHACPKGSILGHARAFTPLLDQPLEGPVYFRSNGGEGGRELPDIVADLNGEVHIILVGFVDAVQHKGSEVSRTRNIFEAVPDAPVTKFVLSLKGGKQGVLENSRNLCSHPQKADVRMMGQNGKRHDFQPVIKTSCKKHKKKHR